MSKLWRDEKRILYIRNLKSASSSIVRFLKYNQLRFDTFTYLDSDDKPFNKGFLGLYSPEEIDINHYRFIFMIVRDPFKRAWSAYTHLKQVNENRLKNKNTENPTFKLWETFEDFLKCHIEINNLVDRRVDMHMKTQSSYLNDFKKLYPDQNVYIDKVNNLDNFYKFVHEQYPSNISVERDTGKANVGEGRRYDTSYIDNYTKTTRDLVLERYAEDFDNFNFSKDLKLNE